MLHLWILSSGAIINFHFCFIMKLLKIIRQCEQKSALFMFNFHVSSRFCWPSSVPHPFSFHNILVLCQSAPGCYAANAICIRFLRLCLCSAFIWIWVFITALPKSFYFFPKYSAECLLLITYSLGTALLSVRHRSSDCLLSLLHAFAAAGLLYFEPPVANGCHEKVKSVMWLKWLME